MHLHCTCEFSFWGNFKIFMYKWTTHEPKLEPNRLLLETLQQFEIYKREVRLFFGIVGCHNLLNDKITKFHTAWRLKAAKRDSESSCAFLYLQISWSCRTLADRQRLNTTFNRQTKHLGCVYVQQCAPRSTTVGGSLNQLRHRFCPTRTRQRNYWMRHIRIRARSSHGLYHHWLGNTIRQTYVRACAVHLWWLHAIWAQLGSRCATIIAAKRHDYCHYGHYALYS